MAVLNHSIIIKDYLKLADTVNRHSSFSMMRQSSRVVMMLLLLLLVTEISRWRQRFPPSFSLIVHFHIVLVVIHIPRSMGWVWIPLLLKMLLPQCLKLRCCTECLLLLVLLKSRGMVVQVSGA